MDIGYRLASLCLAFTVAAGLVPLPDPSGWDPSPPPPPAVTSPEPPPALLPIGGGMEDVAPTDWFFPAIRVGVRHGFVTPIEGRFEPQRAITRAEFITMLGRMHTALGGVVRIGRVPELPFTDITSAAEYIPYLAWATEIEIIRGDAEQRFRPGYPITREELAVLLARYIEAYDIDDQLDVEEHDPYADWFDIADWAYDAVHMLRDLNLLQGRQTEPGVYFFHPAEHVLRLESAVVLARLFEEVFEGRGTI